MARGNVVNPPGAFQCFAVSKTGDPVAGGWNFYSLQITDALNDYPKFGIWPDGLYMSANMFGFAAGGSFQGARAWAFNKAQMYAGNPTIQVVSFNLRRRVHAPAGQRPSANRHAAGRLAELLQRGLALHKRHLGLQVPCRLEQHLALDVHRAIHRHRAHELGQPASHRAGSGRQ